MTTTEMVLFTDTLEPVEFPAFLRERGFRDDSWHNDAMAKATLVLPRNRVLVVWVAEDDPAHREIDNARKFTVCVYATEDDGAWIDEDSVTLCETDDAHEAATAIDKLVNS